MAYSSEKLSRRVSTLSLARSHTPGDFSLSCVASCIKDHLTSSTRERMGDAKLKRTAQLYINSIAS